MNLLARTARTAKYVLIDVIKNKERKPGSLIPPRRFAYLFGGFDYQVLGQKFLQHFIHLGGLRPEDQVLEIGSGIGRMAVPIAEYLTTGSYNGFDIVPPAVQWCQENVSRRYGNTRFVHADVYNRVYNLHGLRPTEFKFPYPDATFDFIFATSVFTHMLPDEIDHYFSQISRVLRPGGRCFTTWFLLNEESLRLLASGKGIQLPYTINGCRAISKADPERTIGVPESAARKAHTGHGVAVTALYPGNWCGREQHTDGQDILVGRKGL